MKIRSWWAHSPALGQITSVQWSPMGNPVFLADHWPHLQTVAPEPAPCGPRVGDTVGLLCLTWTSFPEDCLLSSFFRSALKWNLDSLVRGQLVFLNLWTWWWAVCTFAWWSDLWPGLVLVMSILYYARLHACHALWKLLRPRKKLISSQ